MALITGIFGVLGRFAGRFLNSTLGWATILLFGKVTGRKQVVLLLMTLGSIVWVVTVAATLIPPFGDFLVTALPIPSFVDPAWVRIGIIAAAIVIPIVIGIAALVMAEPERRPRGLRLATAVVRGYPFAALLAVTIILLGVVAVTRKLGSLARRREDVHVPVVVKPGRYDDVLTQLRDVLGSADLLVRQERAPAVLSTPPRLLAAVAGPMLGALVPERLMVLKSPDLDILVYPSDIAISGTKDFVARARAAIASRLTDAPAYMTTTEEAERLEDQLRDVAGRVESASGDPGAEDALRSRLDAIDQGLATITVDFEEWQTLYRERLQVERRILARRAEPARGTDSTAAPADVAAPAAQVALGLAGIALVALDLVLIVIQRLVPPRRR
jgi:hypothetical protein